MIVSYVSYVSSKDGAAPLSVQSFQAVINDVSRDVALQCPKVIGMCGGK